MTKEISRVATRIENTIWKNHLNGQDQKVTTLMIEEVIQDSEILKNSTDKQWHKIFKGICKALGVKKEDLKVA